jgi:hypothetical protein
MPRRLAACAFAASLAACASPTLPLPPPLAPSLSPGADADHVTLTADCNPAEVSAVIVIINHGGSGVPVPAGEAVGGALTNSCGGWTTSVFAHAQDALDITYTIDEQISQPERVTVP